MQRHLGQLCRLGVGFAGFHIPLLQIQARCVDNMRRHLLKPLRIIKGLVAAMHVAADVALDLLEKLNFVDGLGLVRVFAGLQRFQHFGVNFLLNDFQVLGRHAVDVLAHGDSGRLGGFR